MVLYTDFKITHRLQTFYLRHYNVWNQSGDAGNQGRNLSVAIEITWNSNGNDKLEDWREVKIINLVPRI